MAEELQTPGKAHHLFEFTIVSPELDRWLKRLASDVVVVSIGCGIPPMEPREVALFL